MSVRVEHDGPVTTVTIDRPEVRNAVDRATAEALADAFRAFDADDDAAVAVLTGAGGHFCAGADLKAVGDGARQPGRARRRRPDGADPDAAVQAGDRGDRGLRRRRRARAGASGPTCGSRPATRCWACSAAAGACP